MKSTKKHTQNYGKGFSSLKEHWKEDIKAGFGVSLIALPLSLGIALASGFPPMAGLISAIVGGIFVSRFNGSWITIAGPAAGLIVVNLAAVESLGLENALGAILIAGVIIFLFGFLKAGKLGDFFPHSAVHGMLSAIGVIIMVKQFFIAIGRPANGHEFIEIIQEIPVALTEANPHVLFIAFVSLCILIIYPKITFKTIKIIPAPIWVLSIAIPLEFILDFEHEHVIHFFEHDYKVGPKLLVHLPDSLLKGITLPSFEKIGAFAFWASTITIAMVTAIESLLSALAVDSMDPLKRKSELNNDLKALGAGSSISSLFGGLPMISEIVRSSANIASGAKTQWSNFFHGLFLFIFLLFGSSIINHIPLSALAAMLIFTGYRLASPKEFKHVYEIGKSEFIVFLATMIMVLSTDLLLGIFFGILLNLIINIRKGLSFKNLLSVTILAEKNGDVTILKPYGAIGFSNYLSLKKKIFENAASKKIVLDLSKVTFLDHTSIHHIHGIESDRLAEGKEFSIISDEHLSSVSAHPYAEKQANIKAPIHLISARSKDIQNLCMGKDDWEYFDTSLNTSKWEKFYVFNKIRVVSEKHIIKFMITDYPCTIADIELRSAATPGRGENIQMTCVHVGMNIGIIPAFTLEKEQIFDKLVQRIVWQDINFETHPEFSKRYLLKGEDKDAIRAYFNKSLLDYLENNLGYHIESNKKGLLFYVDKKQLTPEEIRNLITFVTGFLHLWK